MRCAGCGTVWGPDEKFCGKCGAPRPQLEARFIEAQRRFTELSARYEAGQVDEASYGAELQGLYLDDGAGSYWMFVVDSNEWNWYDRDQWVRRDPPLAAVMVQPSGAPPPTTTYRPAREPAPEQLLCPICKAPYSPGTRFCNACGSSLVSVPIERGYEPSQAIVPKEPTAPASKRSIPLLLLTPFGWAISWVLGWVFGFIVDTLSPMPWYVAIGGAVGGLITGWALQRAAPSVRWKDALAFTVRFAISWTIGWIVAWAIVGLGKDTFVELGSSISDALGQGALVTRAFLSWGSTWGIAGTIAGIVAGGLAGFSLGRLLRCAEPPIPGRWIVVLTISLPVCWSLGWAVSGAMGAAVAASTGGVILGGTGAGACGLLILWRLGRAQRGA